MLCRIFHCIVCLSDGLLIRYMLCKVLGYRLSMKVYINSPDSIWLLSAKSRRNSNILFIYNISLPLEQPLVQKCTLKLTRKSSVNVNITVCERNSDVMYFVIKTILTDGYNFLANYTRYTRDSNCYTQCPILYWWRVFWFAQFTHMMMGCCYHHFFSMISPHAKDIMDHRL